MSTKLFIDFETYSEVDLKANGATAYTQHESTMPICLSYGYEDGPISLWTPAMEMPSDVLMSVKNGIKVYAHNAMFDWRVWNTICVREFGWPYIPMENVVDTQALCQTYSIPGGLGKACIAMGASEKDTAGLALIKRCCSPQPIKEKGKLKGYRQPNPFNSVDAPYFEKLYAYCLQDTESMRDLVAKLPRQEFIPQEVSIWLLTANMNLEGLPCDPVEIKAILGGIQVFQEAKAKELYTLTRGLITTPNQYKRIKDFCRAAGFPIKNCQGDYIRTLLSNESVDMPDNIRELLTLCEALGKTSTAKFKAFNNFMVPDKAHSAEHRNYRVHDTFCYHGAGTGRWAGRGVQPQNFPRAQSKDPEGDIKKFLDGDYIKDPIDLAKHLVRSVIKAPDGYQLLVADYSSIENRVLAYVAQDNDTLRRFEEGFEQYIAMASARYGVPYDVIEKGYLAEDKACTEYRHMGKVIILGCGFGMGKDTFKETAWSQFKLSMTLEEADKAVRAYRETYPLVVKCWRSLKRAATTAVVTGKQTTYGCITFGTFTIKGIRWLALRMPSGKSIYYHSPRVEDRLVPKFEHMGPTPTVTHMGVHPYSKKWTRLPLIPGRITENAVQGTAREIMAHGMCNAAAKMPYIKFIATVHDEAIALIPESHIKDSTLDEFSSNLCDVPFMPGCPIEAVGFITKRYRKG